MRLVYISIMVGEILRLRPISEFASTFRMSHQLVRTHVCRIYLILNTNTAAFSFPVLNSSTLIDPPLIQMLPALLLNVSENSLRPRDSAPNGVYGEAGGVGGIETTVRQYSDENSIIESSVFLVPGCDFYM